MRVPAGASYRDAVARLYLEDGKIIVFGDCHWRPGLVRSTATSALLRVIREEAPQAVICDGDAHDFPRIGRHPTIGWEEQPTVLEELQEGQTRMYEIQCAAEEVGAYGYWTPGNHDIRFETKLSAQAPDFCGIKGFSLKDHYPAFWQPAWSVHINPHLKQDGVIVQHRGEKGGIYGPRNNAIAYGRTFVQGHLHRAGTFQITNANGTYYGCDAGCLAAVQGPQFVNYTEARPLDWRSAFLVLTIERGRVLMPEHCTVLDETDRNTTFRGRVTVEAE